MNSDSHYSIGKTHKVCQDYALNKDIEDSSYVIVSDGCSGSQNTDIGARLLTLNLSAEISINKNNNAINDFDYSSFLYLIDNINLNISNQAFDATLLSLYVKNNKYSYLCFGDGVIARLHTNGIITATSIEYPSGAPYYLNYELDPERKFKYIEAYGAKRIIKEHVIAPNGSYTNWVSDERDDATYPFVSHGNTNGISTIAIMTDGVFSFTELTEEKIKQSIQLDKILRGLMDYKNFAGEFVYRRMHKFEKECKELGWEHGDDLGMGTIHLL